MPLLSFQPRTTPRHIICAEHKRLVWDYIRSQAELAGIKDPAALASKLNLLLDGAIVDAHVSGNKNSALIAKEMAEVFVERAGK